MLRVVLLIVTATTGVASARPYSPSPPPPQAPEPPESASSSEPTGVRVRAALGFSKYTESGQGFEFAADLQPFALIGADLALRSGRGAVVLQVSAGAGTEVDMAARSQGQVFQRNRFRQEIVDASPRIRWPIGPSIHIDAGYRFTYQRLHIVDVPDIGDALETVNVHALEAGLIFARAFRDGSRRQLELAFGINRAFADNDRIDDEDFSASGFSFSARGYRQWASRFSIEGVLTIRKQNGSAVERVMFEGMEVDAQWPDNSTWLVLLSGGYAFD